MNSTRFVAAIYCLALLFLCANSDFGLYLLVNFAWVPLALFMPPLFSTTAGSFYWAEAQLSATLTVNGPTSLTDLTTGTSTAFTSGTTDCMCYDRLNDLLWQASSTSVVARSTNPASGTSTYSFTAPQSVVAIDCDPTNSRVFYITKNGGSFDVRSINYDGTSDTSLVTWSSGGFTNAEIDIRYDLTTDRVYYVKCFTSPSSTTELRYIDPSGSGDTLVASKSDPFSGYGRIHSIAIDVTNQYLFWVESTNTFGANIQRSDMTGGSVTTVYSSLGSGTYKITFSQLQSKLYVWMGNGGLGSGDVVRYMNNDGTSNTSLGIPAGSTTGAKSAWFALGSGFETIGGSAIL